MTRTSQRKAVGDTVSERRPSVSKVSAFLHENNLPLKVRLPCDARGKPSPRVKWYRERGASRIEVSDSPTLVLKQVRTVLFTTRNLLRSITLCIIWIHAARSHLALTYGYSQITAADTGVYTCVAVNLVGVAVRNYTVTVDQLGPAGTGGPAQEKQPALTGGPENTTVQQGDTARLECVVR